MVENHDGEIADERFEKIIQAISNQDKESLKNIFSQKALLNNSDFEETAQYLFNLIDGKVKRTERKGMSGWDELEIEYTKKTIYSWYRIETDKRSYYFILVDFIIDTKNPSNVGLYALRVIESEEDPDFSWEEVEGHPGISTPSSY